MTNITGDNLIGAQAKRGGGPAFHAATALTGESLAPAFHEAAAADIAAACALAEAAFDVYRALPPERRAAFLDAAAAKIDALGDPLIERVMLETGLPEARVRGELGRTTMQLRLFADEPRDGGWLEARADPALPDRGPAPRPDIRTRHIPLGPVAVFGASNFPLAFSAAGGDTASALAAGCPVVVKAHPAHPGTSELVGRAIQAAVAESGMPEGVFSLIHGGAGAGAALVRDPRIKAVGFTGSRAGGFAIAATAAARPEPIPVFGELSSVNPVVVLPAALRARGAEIGAGLAASVTLGAGQFCTNPGLVFVIAETDADYAAFRDAVRDGIAAAPAVPMLTTAIGAAYEAGVAALAAHPGVTEVARGASAAPCHAGAVFETDLETFAGDDALQAEVFGAVTLLVRCGSLKALRAALAGLEGQLTATLQMDADDADVARALVPLLERKAGRILVNGFPTGVEVVSAMVHGGPFPATTDGRSTSVGTLAIRRFLRPVCYQNFPADLLPPELASPEL